jgi:CRP/FNR family cyclic AMP-dependent transcriptional regulator
MPHPSQKQSLSAIAILQAAGVMGAFADYRAKQVIFTQGSLADLLYCVQQGAVKLSVVSTQGKGAVTGILPAGTFFGEGCLSGQQVRSATATALTDSSVAAFPREDVLRAIRENHDVAQFLISYLLMRNAQIEEDLTNQLFNSSEKRLARTLLHLARQGVNSPAGLTVPNVTQETLAQIVGTTRSRVSFFMNKFRRLGYIEYNGELRIHRSLSDVLRD